ncbi:Putative glycosyltransferase, DXD sugar-binding, nucleotide-diphospho-sugar transferase [Colletotrichum destructivum]|uniref:Glycosyltransferase, DXD sugar-binding, nucleotide-diphospho-sugar transferase n=1 Tax=Colletotrichum destructivum TaxID=34406 RepID=A0AAX4I7U5_9PEZI|nr:Putative glycosyltransferase, DXD sugar-binding, nucleotide-diphospho-sugar transferase [Colletotrichum destructivum]
MLKTLQYARLRRSRHTLLCVGILGLITFLWSCRLLLYTTWTLVSLPFTWGHDESKFLISDENDGFDVVFANYSRVQQTAGPSYEDKIPPILHHIILGNPKAARTWQHARQSCLDMHPGWESHLWTDDKAAQFVAEKFPQLKEMWDDYRHPVQRVDALRYLLLHEYGGVVLDMDLRCRRALGPLRRFDFVAPAAHPIGVSNGFMMASKNNEFLKDIILSLKTYNRWWFGLAYPTVMFSTGCHFASTIHSLQRNRTAIKVLAGPKGNPNLHRLNGAVSTPLFDHLGSSSWHSFDAAFIVSLGRLTKHQIFFLSIGNIAIVVLLRRLCVCRRLRSCAHQSENGMKAADV